MPYEYEYQLPQKTSLIIILPEQTALQVIVGNHPTHRSSADPLPGVFFVPTKAPQ